MSLQAKARSQVLPPRAPGGSTCPWGAPGAEDGQAAPYRRDTSVPRSTCPWGDDGNQAKASSGRRSLSNTPKDTCPWSASGSGQDGDSIAIQNAARRRHRPPPSNEGCAGHGAPRAPSRERDMMPAQRLMPEASCRAPSRERDAQPAQRDAPSQQMGQELGGCGPTADEDDAEERNMLIEKCLAHGLDDEQIIGVLEEHKRQKMQAKLEQMQQEQVSQPEQFQHMEEQQTALPETFPPKAAPTSLAAKRQAKAAAKKSLSFGPSDEEIVSVIQEHMTPPDTPPDAGPTSLAAKRAKARDVSTTTIGSFDSDRSRSAYIQSQQQAAACRSKNRASQGIFG